MTPRLKRERSEPPRAAMETARSQADAMFPGRVWGVAWTPGSDFSDICVEIIVDTTGRRKVVPWGMSGPA